LPSYCPKEFYQYQFEAWRGGIVYQGRVDIKSKLDNVNFRGFQYCQYEDMADAFKEHGVDFHIYSPGNVEKKVELFKDRAIYNGSFPYLELLRKIGAHDWGLVGNIHKTNQWDIAEPNKLYEYIAACVPVCVMNASNSANIVRNLDVGIVVESVLELTERWKEHREKRINLIKIRDKLSMENNINKLEVFYGKFI
jgi:hypothetical protein